MNTQSLCVYPVITIYRTTGIVLSHSLNKFKLSTKYDTVLIEGCFNSMNKTFDNLLTIKKKCMHNNKENILIVSTNLKELKIYIV